MYWNGSAFKNARPGLGQQVEREHLARDEEVQGHHDIEERRHLEEPEPDHPDAHLEEEADQERQHQRDQRRRRSVIGPGKPSKKPRQTKKSMP